jgi:hypothetical protein
MKAWLSGAMVGVLLSTLAFAAPPGRDGSGRGAQEPRGRQDDRAAYQRNAPNQRRMEPAPQRREGALTDEERQGLHRDLDKANREIYRRR